MNVGRFVVICLVLEQISDCVGQYAALLKHQELGQQGPQLWGQIVVPKYRILSHRTVFGESFSREMQ